MSAREASMALSRTGPLNGYFTDHHPAWLDLRRVDFDSDPWEVLDSSVPLTSDGAVRLIPTPGHTKGHLSVVVEPGQDLRPTRTLAPGHGGTRPMTEETNALLIERFYTAFDTGDGDTMAACYAPNVQFSDPVFPDLRGSRAGAMWKMLTGAGGDLRVELLEHHADEARGSAHWRPTTRSPRPGARSSTTSTRAFASRTA